MNILDFLKLVPAVIASGKSANVIEDLSGLAPVLAPVLEGSETETQFVAGLIALHDNGKLKMAIGELNELLLILDRTLDDPEHKQEVISTLQLISE